MRGVHRGMRGEVIGGYTAEGQALGTKGGKAAWKAAPAAAPAAGVAPAAPAAVPAAPAAAEARPNALGGGLARWKSMNPMAKAAFAAGSPANDKATNRRIAQPMKQKAAPGFTNTPSLASMPPAKNWAQATAIPAAGGGKPAWKKPMMAAR